MNELRKLRRATLADASIVHEITRKAYSKWISVINREPGPMQVDYQKAILEHLIELYEDHETVHGLVELVPKDGHLLIENIAVLPASQGQGIGDILLQHAESVAVSLDLPELRLYTNAAFTENVSYYLKRGYSVFERAPIPSGGTVVHMKKTALGTMPTID